MKITKRQFIAFSLLSMPSFSVLSCMAPDTIYKKLDRKLFRQGNLDDFLNEIYGSGKWMFDDKNLELTTPKIVENPAVSFFL